VALWRVSRSEPASVWAAFGSLLGPVRWEGADPGRRCLLVGGVLARIALGADAYETAAGSAVESLLGIRLRPSDGLTFSAKLEV
jgi:hypothetical protein